MFIEFIKVRTEELREGNGETITDIPLNLIKFQISRLRDDKIDNIHLCGKNTLRRNDIWDILDHVRDCEFQRLKVSVDLTDISPALIQKLFAYQVYFFEFDFTDFHESFEPPFFKYHIKLHTLKKGINMIKKTDIHKKINYSAFIQMNLSLNNKNWKDLKKIVAFGLNQLLDVILVSLEPDVPYDMLLPHIEKSIALMLKKKPLLFFHCIPFCLLKGNEYFIWELYQQEGKDPLRIFLPTCISCIFINICQGIPVECSSYYSDGFFSAIENGNINAASIYDFTSNKFS